MLQLDTISVNDYLQEALRLMVLSRLDCLQVLEGIQVIGLIYRQDIERLPESVLRGADVREYYRKLDISQAT